MGCRVIFIAGVPASGKTTLLKHIRKRAFEGFEVFSHGTCKGISAGNAYMLGVFDESTFEGTDRLSMSCIGDTLDFISSLQTAKEKSVVILEGDRLFNSRFIESARAEVYIIEADPATIAARHATRGDAQNSTFLKSRRTKVENMIKKYNLRRLKNTTEQDMENLVSAFVRIIKKSL